MEEIGEYTHQQQNGLEFKNEREYFVCSVIDRKKKQTFNWNAIERKYFIEQKNGSSSGEKITEKKTRTF